jgi:sulfur-oxidizing protein SoxY
MRQRQLPDSQQPRPRAQRGAWSAALLGLLLSATGGASADTQAPAGGAWQYMRTQFYGTRDIGELGDQLMSIEAPASTPDPAATAVVVRFGPELTGKVKQVRVIIDNNPSPLVTTMDLAPGLPVEEIDLRLRIDRFTSVRAIAETGTGRLEMRSTWVNASGGCSAPPSAAAGGKLGEIRFRPSADARALQISIHHPNNSGFQIDPRSGDPIPPHFISHIRLLSGTEVLLQADTGISLSENPTLRLATTAPLPAPITFEATDIPSQQLFSATWSGGGAGTASR